MRCQNIRVTIEERCLQEELMQTDEPANDNCILSLTRYQRRHAIHKSVELLAPESSQMNLHYVITNLEKKEAKIYNEAQSKLSYYALLAKHICIGRKLIAAELERRQSLPDQNGM